jgi:spoIIIJ-associated protein
MNPYDRRIIHLTLKNDSRVNTKSIGEGVYKKVVILPRKASKS